MAEKIVKSWKDLVKNYDSSEANSDAQFLVPPSIVDIDNVVSVEPPNEAATSPSETKSIEKNIDSEKIYTPSPKSRRGRGRGASRSSRGATARGRGRRKRGGASRGRGKGNLSYADLLSEEIECPAEEEEINSSPDTIQSPTLKGRPARKTRGNKKIRLSLDSTDSDDSKPLSMLKEEMVSSETEIIISKLSPEKKEEVDIRSDKLKPVERKEDAIEIVKQEPKSQESVKNKISSESDVEIETKSRKSRESEEKHKLNDDKKNKHKSYKRERSREEEKEKNKDGVRERRLSSSDSKYKDKDRSKERDRDRDKHKGRSSDKSRERDRDKHRSEKEKRERAKGKSNSDKKSKDRDKEKSKDGDHKDQNKDGKKDQAERDRDTLNKVKPLSIDGLAKIPRKTSSINTAGVSFMDALGSADSDVSENSKRSTVKVKARGFRSTGLMDEHIKPPGVAGKRSIDVTATSSSDQSAILSQKKVLNASPIDKKSTKAQATNLERLGGIKLISPKRRKFVFILILMKTLS